MIIIIFRRRFSNSHQFFYFLTVVLFLMRFRIEMDISYHFHKIRLEREIFSPTFARENGPISCLS